MLAPLSKGLAPPGGSGSRPKGNPASVPEHYNYFCLTVLLEPPASKDVATRFRKTHHNLYSDCVNLFSS